MKFSLAINMERMSPDLDMREVARHTLEMVQMADEGGFEIAWAAEHHAIEMTIAPAPFPLLAWWAAHTSRIRLGTAVVVAPYWHPIKVAGEAIPTTVVTGADDRRSSAAMALAMAERLPHGRCHIIPGQRHMTPLEVPDLVAALIAGRPLAADTHIAAQ
jgi:pimeloyl-ACP methyl ester carboxylesterase